MSKEVEVTCCFICPMYDNHISECLHPEGIEIADFSWWKSADMRVHEKCPLKSGSITIKLKEVDNGRD